MMKVLITGGTGTLGRELTDALEKAGYTVRIGSRRARPETIPDEREWARMQIGSGEGVSEGVEGVDAIIHAASDPRQAQKVDVEGTRRLVEAARDTSVQHFVYISIVGIDEIPFGYYKRKLEAERIVEAGGMPYSILRATQFHSFVEMLISPASRVPFTIPLPADFRVQSVAVSEVAVRLARCLREGPGQHLSDFGGPEVMTLGEATEIWKQFTGVSKRLVRLPVPGSVAAGFRAGKNTVRSGEHGTITWREWLQQRYGPKPVDA